MAAFKSPGLGSLTALPYPYPNSYTAILSFCTLPRLSLPPASPPMNSYTTEPEPSHGDLLADRLRRLDPPNPPHEIDQPVPVDLPDGHPPPSVPRTPHEGYGFRPASGMSSPRAPPPDRNSPLPDVNGLGWPGVSTVLLIPPLHALLTHCHPRIIKQSRPSLVSMLPLPRMPLVKPDSPPRCAPSSSASGRILIEKASFAHQNDTPRP